MMDRRIFLFSGAKYTLLGLILPDVFGAHHGLSAEEAAEIKSAVAVPDLDAAQKAYFLKEHRHIYLIDATKCIGCGSCVRACYAENKVPAGYFRTWIERYIYTADEQLFIDSPDGGKQGFSNYPIPFKVTKSYFVPKMCNHCQESPCMQVCPVGASYLSPNGMVLVDDKRCIGCGYCVQACPYGSRFINPESKVADKCTWCYHRVIKGLKPACVDACPNEVRHFGDMRDEQDPVRHMLETERVGILQPELLTRPKCYYKGLDQEVR